MSLICFNGKYIAADQPVLLAHNRSYRYGDGFFETLKVHNGALLLAPYHQQRIERSLRLLQYRLRVHVHNIFENILHLCSQNNVLQNARVRLSFSNGNGSLYDAHHTMDYIIETTPLHSHANCWNPLGLTTGICPLVQKSTDAYASLKAASSLPYRIAAAYATRHHWDDAFILNTRQQLIETTIANLFWVKDHTIFTPPLAAGCVHGVMRTYLIECLHKAHIALQEMPCTEKDLLQADEIFVTNAIMGIKWVGRLGNRTYAHHISKDLFTTYLKPMYA